MYSNTVSKILYTIFATLALRPALGNSISKLGRKIYLWSLSKQGSQLIMCNSALRDRIAKATKETFVGLSACLKDLEYILNIS